MRPIQEWDVSDLQRLISDGVQESLVLDYKESTALTRSDKSRNEISKDVSAFANSAGGTIVYGIIEKNRAPVAVDSGAADQISREWLEQVINSTIQPRLTGVIIKAVELASGGYAYAVSVPQTKFGGPHQANDRKYYRRFNFESVPMYDYEIKDIMRRASRPELFLRVDAVVVRPGATGPVVQFSASVGNNSPEPALYASVSFFIDTRIAPSEVDGMETLEVEFPASSSQGSIRMRGFDRNFSVANHQPLYQERLFRAFRFETTVHNNAIEFHVGYILCCPGFRKVVEGKIIRNSETMVSLMFPSE